LPFLDRRQASLQRRKKRVGVGSCAERVVDRRGRVLQETFGEKSFVDLQSLWGTSGFYVAIFVRIWISES